MAKKTYTGINIQYPISQLILSGEKTIETRTYPIPEKYLNQDMVMIETPGQDGDFKARVVGIINFSSCYKYESLQKFRSEFHLHKVEAGSKWDWIAKKPKWGWLIGKVTILTPPQTVKKTKGIVFTKDLTI